MLDALLAEWKLACFCSLLVLDTLYWCNRNSFFVLLLQVNPAVAESYKGGGSEVYDLRGALEHPGQQLCLHRHLENLMILGGL